MLEEVRRFSEQKVWGTRTIIIEENKKPKEYIIWDSYYSKDDIEELLNKNKFKVVSVNEELIDSNEFTSNDVMFF